MDVLSRNGGGMKVQLRLIHVIEFREFMVFEVDSFETSHISFFLYNMCLHLI